MKRKLKLLLNNFYHDMSMSDLRLQNKDKTSDTLTHNDILYLNVIETGCGQYTASKLADMIGVSRPAVTQKINDLEKQGYIKKVQSTKDKRTYFICMNDDYFSSDYYKLVSQTNKDIVKKLTEEHTDEQIQLFCDMCEKISKILLNETKRG